MNWQLAVSTLGMPGVTVSEAVRVAAEHGCHGVEIRTHPDEEVHIGLTAREVGRLRARIADAGLAVPCLAGYARLCAPGPHGRAIDELRSLIELAHQFGAPAIRAFPGGEGDPASDDARAHERIGAVLEELRDSGVRLLVETHDSHPTGSATMRLVEPFAAPGLVAVLWDALHPWRCGEPPARTRAVLAGYLGYFQLKDVAGTRDLTPLRPGQGDIPLAECGQLLQSWSGWVSLEWERAWYPSVEPVGAPLEAAAAWFGRWRPCPPNAPS
ncbi:sugar phosphate isomerase/epimerase family protein [Amycolatopsis aidingensis]|uniref:sugar phosphate isomerase/epimerase family protein n=1 Tax=Amycolatopsis aidingensis TaxID=2842453 RepID=UPI001C0DF751|nr:sugar phosphate isomerase/epimerase family protein [Amycolatopsis aidingensis]